MIDLFLEPAAVMFVIFFPVIIYIIFKGLE